MAKLVMPPVVEIKAGKRVGMTPGVGDAWRLGVVEERVCALGDGGGSRAHE